MLHTILHYVSYADAMPTMGHGAEGDSRHVRHVMHAWVGTLVAALAVLMHMFCHAMMPVGLPLW